MSTKDPLLWPIDDDDPRVLVAPGQTALFPEPNREPKWKDAETDPNHRADFRGETPRCSCGWEGPSWVVHFTSTRGK